MGGSLAWNSECTGGLLGLEFQKHERVSSPGVLKGGGVKNSDLLTSEVRKTSLYACVLNKLSRKGMTTKLGCAAYLELP